MYVCKNIYVRSEPYRLDCHGGATVIMLLNLLGVCTFYSTVNFRGEDSVSKVMHALLSLIIFEPVRTGNL